MRVRGLKPSSNVWTISNLAVAPRAGAWIETRNIHIRGSLDRVAPRAGAWIETVWGILKSFKVSVAPRAGAWIETFSRVFNKDWIRSHPVRVRGLKLILVYVYTLRLLVAPRAGAWIETDGTSIDVSTSDVAPRAGAWIETLLLIFKKLKLFVAPRAGAWIETKDLWDSAKNEASRTPCGCVD